LVFGYGYQFWINQDGSYRGDGMYGQFCIVLPEQDAVIVTTAGERRSTRSLMDTIRQTILPKLQ
jgi:CubicO group peptidase (beta-lactamase class C family)